MKEGLKSPLYNETLEKKMSVYVSITRISLKVSVEILNKKYEYTIRWGLMKIILSGKKGGLTQWSLSVMSNPQ